MGHGSLLKVTSTRAAFARPGPGVTLFPDVLAPMQPSDSLPPSATAPVPLASGLPRCGRLFCASEADDTCARQRVVRRRRVTGSPQDRKWVEERRGPPRLLDRPLPTCHGRTPRRIRSSPRPLRAEGVVAFKSFSTLGIREEYRFRGRMLHGPHVRMPTHRRGHFWHRRKARYRLGRAHPWPGGIRTRWTTDEVS